MTVLTVAVAGATVAGGLLLVVLGLARRPVPPPAPRRGPARRAGPSRRSKALLAVGAGLGALTALVTGWLLAVVLVPLALVGVPVLLAAPPAQGEIDRVEAMEEWVRTLAGTLGAGVGLEQALVRSLRSAPQAIGPEVARLAGRLRARWSTGDALRAFADDLDDATGDLIAANLLLAANRRGGGLTAVLEGLARSVAEDVKNRRDIEADRAKPRGNARIITMITLVVLGILALSGDYVAPYGSPLGQVLLACLLGLYAGLLVWLRQMARGRPIPRFVGAQVAAGRRAAG